MTALATQPDFPTLEFGQSRWATARTESVDVVAERWTSKPNYVQVLSDPRLRDAQIVMLRRDIFERFLATFQDLQSGRLAIRLELEQAADFTTVLVQEAREGPAKQLAQTFLKTFQRIRAQLVRFGIVRPLAPTSLDAHELAIAEEQLRRDAKDD